LNSELSLAKADQRKHDKRHGEVDPGIPVTDEKGLSGNRKIKSGGTTTNTVLN
jgi:hypothetical protein